MKRFGVFIIAIVCIIPGAIYAQGVVGNAYNQGYQGWILDQSGNVAGTGVMQPLGGSLLTPRVLVQHLLLTQDGIGTMCAAGVQPPTAWSLDPTVPVDTKDKIVAEIQTAESHDTRLRQVHIFDDAIDMYYLQPAYVWGFIPANYNLHVSANGNTLHVSLDKPKWVASAKNYHSQVTAAFSQTVPAMLSPQVVAQLETDDLIDRDAVMINIVSAAMYQVSAEPISNSFFVCYILPFLLYILALLVIIGMLVWWFVRRLKRESGYMIKKVQYFEEELEQDKGVNSITKIEQHTTTFNIGRPVVPTPEDEKDDELDKMADRHVTTHVPPKH